MRMIITTLITFFILGCGQNEAEESVEQIFKATQTETENNPIQQQQLNSSDDSAPFKATAQKRKQINHKKSGPKNYNDARPVFWKKIYYDGGETLYCGESFGRGYNAGLNIEHVFPMSWATKTLRCGTRSECRRNSDQFNTIEADLHNLYPSRKDINDIRSSISFGMINGERRDFGSCDFEVVERGKRLVEPRPEVRGNIARAMFYMAKNHDLNLYDRQIKLLKKWHNEDPVDQQEQQRNDRIEAVQGNRNEYIDSPKQVTKDW